MDLRTIRDLSSRLRGAWRRAIARPMPAPLGTIRRLDCLEYEERILFSATPAGGEVLVNTTTAATQTVHAEAQQAVATDPTGAFVVAWTGDNADGLGTGIVAQRFDAAGNKLGAELHVNSTTLGDQTEAAVAKAADGSFIVAWSGPILDILGITILGEGVYFQRYDAAGNQLGTEVGVALALLGDFSEPSIAINAAGDFAISWTRAGGDGSGDAIYARQFHANGTPDGLPFQVNSTSAGDQNGSTVAFDGNGNFIITWTSAGQDGSGLGVYGQRFDSSGGALGGEFLVNSTTAGNQTDAAVAADTAGNFLVTWSSQGQDGSGYGIYGQRFNAAGARIGTEFQVNVTTIGDQRDSRIAMDGSGSFVVAWTSTNQDAPGGDGVYFRQYDATATAISPETLVNRTVAGSQLAPSVALQSSNSFVVAWSGAGAGDADGVFLQRYVDGANSAPVNTVPGTQVTVEDTPLVFSSGAGNAISINDASAASNPVQVTLTITSGTATLSGTAGLTFSAGDGTADAVMTFTGMMVDINAALNGLTFTPTLDFAGTAALGISTNDLGYSGTGGAQTTTSSVSITVTPVNDHVPTITSDGGGASASVNVAENTTAVTTVVGADADMPTPTLTYSITGGTDAALFAIDSATGALTFITAPDFEAPADSNSDNVYQVIVSASDGTFFASQTILTTVTNVNEPTIITVPLAPATNEDTPLVFSTAGGNAISVADPDAAGLALQVTLTGTNGSVSVGSLAGLTFLVGDGSSDGTMTFQGSAAAINAALDGLSFASPANFNGAAQLQISVDDLGHSGSGPAQVTTNTLGITVNSVNDAPTLALPGVQSTPFQTAIEYSAALGRAITLADVDAGSGIVQLTLTAAHGTLTLAQTSGLTFLAGDGADDGLMIVRGSLTNLNAALDGLVFTPTTGYRGPAGVAVSIDDLGLSGGAAQVTAGQLDVTVLPAADRFQLQAPSSLNADNFAATFSSAAGSGIAIVDAYGEDPILTVTLTATAGIATLAQATGLTFVGQSGPSGGLLAFSGRLSDVNAALDGLRFDGTSTAALMTITVTDEPRDGTAGQTHSVSVGITQASIFPSPGPGTTGSDDSAFPRIDTPNVPNGPSRVAIVPMPIGTANGDGSGLLGDERHNSVDAMFLPGEAKLSMSLKTSLAGLGIGLDDGAYGSGRAGHADWGAMSSAAGKSAAALRAAVGARVAAVARSTESLTSAEAMIPWTKFTAVLEEHGYTTTEYLVVGTAGITATLTVGYLVWSLQAGSLTSILLSSLPTWRSFDPLPVLEYERRQKRRMLDVDELDSVFEARGLSSSGGGALGAR